MTCTQSLLFPLIIWFSAVSCALAAQQNSVFPAEAMDGSAPFNLAIFQQIFKLLGMDKFDACQTKPFAGKPLSRECVEELQRRLIAAVGSVRTHQERHVRERRERYKRCMAVFNTEQFCNVKHHNHQAFFVWARMLAQEILANSKTKTN